MRVDMEVDMTKEVENAMKTLSDIADAMPSMECKDWKIAINTVLEALEQEPCENAVSRTNLLKKFEDRFIELQKAHQKEKQLGVNWCINTLKDMPPVTPTRKKGHWNLLDECANSGYYCSECHKKVVKEGWSDTVKKIKFCPNCGAEMER